MDDIEFASSVFKLILSVLLAEESIMELEIGQLTTAPFLPTSAEVKKFEPRQGYYRLELLLRAGSNCYLSRNINPTQLDKFKCRPMSGGKPAILMKNSGCTL